MEIHKTHCFQLGEELSHVYADVFCAAENAVLCATNLGLGTVYIGMVLAAMTEIRKEFGLPDKVVPVVALCVGYPKKVPAGIIKPSRSAMVHSEQYEEKSPEELKRLYREKHGDLWRGWKWAARRNFPSRCATRKRR